MEIDKLQISISADASQAIREYKKLAKALTELQAVTQKEMGFSKLANKINQFAKAIHLSLNDIERLGNACEKITKASNAGFAKTAKDINKAKLEMQKAMATTNGTASGDGAKTPDAQGAEDGIQAVGDAAEDSGRKVAKATSKWDKFWKAIWNIAKYRAVRAALSKISQLAKEGTDNLYTFINASDTKEAKKLTSQLDQLSTTMTALGNTLGVTILSTIASAAPIIETLAVGLMQILDVINALIAELNHSHKYLKANIDALKKWSETVNYAVQGFDELNVISGSTGANPFTMFDEADTSTAIDGLDSEAGAVMGLVGAFLALKIGTKLLTASFNKKNSSLSKQTSETVTETSKVGALSSAFSSAFDHVTDLLDGYGMLEGVLGTGVAVLLAEQVTQLGNAFGKVDLSTYGVKLHDTLVTADAETSTYATETETNLGTVTSAFSTAFDKIADAYEAFVVRIKNAWNTEDATDTLPDIGLDTGSALEANKSPYTTFSLKPAGATAPNSSTESITSYKANDGVTAESYDFIKEYDPSESSISFMDAWNASDGIWEKLGTLVWYGLRSSITGTESTSSMPVPLFKANGGFVNSADLFYANENGNPEMIGKIGNRTAVANNDQITEAIASAVYDAITSANMSNTVNVTLEGDAKKMFNVVQQQARNYRKTTGQYAF